MPAPADIVDFLTTLPRNARSAQLQEKLAVGMTADLERILTIPRRTEAHDLPGGRWHSALNHLTAEAVTQIFRTPGGVMTLRPLQAQALVEAARSRGLVGRIPVGVGKTLISALLPEALDAKRALILVPASLLGSFDRELSKYLAHFKIPTARILKVISHDELSKPAATKLLERLQPDTVIVDEIDAFANRESVRTSRLFQYGRKDASVKWAVLSGTVFQNSIKDAVYWFALALRRRSPLPLARGDIEAWSEALDPLPLGLQARSAGALHRLCGPGETPRQGWNRRAADTVGVVTSHDDKLVGVSLNLHERIIQLPAKVKDILQQVAETWTRPDGKQFSLALDLRRLEKQLVAGFYHRWKEEPPTEWLDARTAWCREVRSRLSHGVRRAGMDSPYLVEQAAERGEEIESILSLRDGVVWTTALAQRIRDLKLLPHYRSPFWVQWKQHINTPEPESVAVEVDDYLYRDAAQWGKEHKGIIWYAHTHVGQRIAQMGSFPLYGAGDDRILDERGDRTVVASIQAHGVGKNLQAFNKALVVELMSSGKKWEQLLGRLHRNGQENPTVDYWLYMHCEPFKRAWYNALRKARFMRDMNGNDQRILYAAKSFEDAYLIFEDEDDEEDSEAPLSA